MLPWRQVFGNYLITFHPGPRWPREYQTEHLRRNIKSVHGTAFVFSSLLEEEKGGNRVVGSIQFKGPSSHGPE